MVSMLRNRRILLIDDMPTIHKDFQKILAAPAPASDLETALFGVAAESSFADFELDSAYQGQDGLEKVEQSLQADLPYAMAFVDMRMPPGWDGLETIERLWQKDHRIQMVICTAYSDYSWEKVLSRLNAYDRLLILKKPFDAIEVLQLANTLTAKWEKTQQAALTMSSLEDAVQKRTLEIFRINEMLQTEIIERKHLESRLVQSETLASIGQLAAGVAHEINNPIGYIFSNIGTLEKYLANLFEVLAAYENAEQSLSSPEIAADLKSLCKRVELAYLKEDIPILIQESKEGVSRVRKIVHDLKNFSRVDSDQQWEWANIHQSIDSTLNLIASEIKHTADVAKEYGTLPEIECLPSQISQVIMSLMINAAQAIGPQRGQITIRTGLEGKHIWIEVVDNGCGIPSEVFPRIFEPFFTTKPVGKGTGLGLSLSYGIVQKHHGRIDVQTEIGRGSIFRVTLPIKHQEVKHQEVDSNENALRIAGSVDFEGLRQNSD